MNSELEITLNFSGGAELLFGKIKLHTIKLPSQETWCMKKLLVWIKENLLMERPELFLQGDTVRPGILVLVNNADWELVVGYKKQNSKIVMFDFSELLGQLDYNLQNKDEIVFISTLHGG